MSGNEKRMPTHRLKFRSKEKVTYDVGTCWPGKFPDSFDVKPETQRKDGQYPAMPLSEALRLVEQREGWLSLSVVKPKNEQRGSGQQQRRGETADDFSDDSIPF